MNKRDAKIKALGLCSMCIDAAIPDFQVDDGYMEGGEEGFDKTTAAMAEISDALMMRAAKLEGR